MNEYLKEKFKIIKKPPLDKEATQKVFDNACHKAGLSKCERHEFNNYMHSMRLLKNCTEPEKLRILAKEWQGSSFNPCISS